MKRVPGGLLLLVLAAGMFLMLRFAGHMAWAPATLISCTYMFVSLVLLRLTRRQGHK